MATRPWLQGDSDLCRDCQACVLACSLYHEGRCGPGLARLAIEKDMARYTFTVTVCRHCVSPACMEACPAGALDLDDRGVVVLDDAACIRCGACMEACPYGAISYNAAADRYLKCDLCAGRERPLCVEICPVGAVTGGQAPGGDR